MVRAQYSSVSTLHLSSDGPTTHYRQKSNFLPCRSFHLIWGSTRFRGIYGKSAPDGIGGTLKRTADILVRHGNDIPDAASLYRALMKTGTSVKLFYVDEDEVATYEKKIPTNVPVVEGTMEIHEVIA